MCSKRSLTPTATGFAAPFVPESGNGADQFVINFQDLDVGQTSYTEDGFWCRQQASD